MDGFVMFLWGLGGSIAVELLTLHEIFRRDATTIPVMYRSTAYWLVRIGLALAGGMLAVAYEVHTPVLAMNIGASANLVLHRFAVRAPFDPETRSA